MFPAHRFTPMYTPDKDYIWTNPDTKVDQQVAKKGVPMPLADAVRFGIVSPEEAHKLTGGTIPTETKQAAQRAQEAADSRAATYRQAGTGTLNPEAGTFSGVKVEETPARAVEDAPQAGQGGQTAPQGTNPQGDQVRRTSARTTAPQTPPVQTTPPVAPQPNSTTQTGGTGTTGNE